MGAQNSQRMGTTFPVGALRVDPILSFTSLLRIEAVFQHVVSNTTRYSKAVWMSLTPAPRISPRRRERRSTSSTSHPSHRPAIPISTQCRPR